MARPTVGGLWAATDAVVRRHFSAFATLSAATVFLPAAALRLLAPAMGRLPTLDLKTPPPSYSPWLWLALAGVTILQLFAIVAIAAVSADPDEGAEHPFGRTIADALPAMLKLLGAALLFALAYVVAIFVLALVLALVGAIFGVALSGTGGNPSEQALQVGAVVLVVALFAVIAPLLFWAFARLAPLTGVYLREQLGVIGGIRRAWTMSKGSAGTIVGLTLLFWLGSSMLIGIGIGAQLAAGASALVTGVTGLFTAAFSAVYMVYFAAFTGIVYRQLAVASAGDA